jgi:prophage regulatory protein
VHLYQDGFCILPAARTTSALADVASLRAVVTAYGLVRTLLPGPRARDAWNLEWRLSSNDFNTRMEMAMAMADSILRLPAVKTRVGLSRSAIYLAVSRAEFPRPVHLGARAVGWLDSEISEWLRDRVKNSRKLQ